VSEQGDAALERARAAGVHRLAIPTPFAVGRVNAYLIESEPLTLVDSGPNSAHAFDALERGLAELGREVSELGLLVITHQHPDHLGLADVLARRSGAEVAAFGPLGDYLDRYHEAMELDDRFAERVMLRHGVARDLVTALRAVTGISRGWGSRVHVTRPLADGETIELADRRLQVLHRPGHSPSDLLLWDADRAILLVADHLLARISSNPLISRPLDRWDEGDIERPSALLAFIESMRRTATLPAQVVLTGHGEPVVDHAQLIADRIAMHERRARRIHGLLRERGPLTAHAIAAEMWGQVAVTQAYLSLSEALGHLDLLVFEDQAEELREGELSLFQAR
jgi:glyoxylase-like metal-dependent hydrolase (beta-lactamase superfamily II)